MQQQVEKLYRATFAASTASRAARNDLRMLLDVEDLNSYLQFAFNHFSSTLKVPFDFVQASFQNSQIPADFGGNILKLALGMMDAWKDNGQLDAHRIFCELSYMVASCIMLDSARHKNKGQASSIYPKYIAQLDDALENFCDHHWPCQYVSPKTGVRCINVRVGHKSKGHQSRDGKVFATGDYITSFSFHNNYGEFRDMVYSCLVMMLQELTFRVAGGQSEERAAANIHKEMILTNFYRRINHIHSLTGSTFISSHTACFCCLFEQAEHPLPCGHVLCTRCVNTYGFRKSPGEVEINECPIDNLPGWTIYFKPKAAGVRVLTLDGGGIRGIVELEVLRQIERELDNIAIQHFFDLIVGTRYIIPTLCPTDRFDSANLFRLRPQSFADIRYNHSTGGLIALGLGPMNWSVEEVTNKFEMFCATAFTQRSGVNLPIVGTLIENYHHSKYQTSTLESVLIDAFSSDLNLFGGYRSNASTCNPAVKVAVTATPLAGKKTYLLANYNRPREAQGTSEYRLPRCTCNRTCSLLSIDAGNYHFHRPERSSDELKIWEA